MNQTHAAPHPISKEFIALMAALMSVVAISIDAMLPALGIIRDAFQTSHPNDVQLIISCIFVGMAVGELICGPLSDAYGRMKVLYTYLGIYLLGSIVCLFSDTLEHMLVGRFIQGLGVAGPFISCMSIVRDTYSGRTMAKVMSLVMMVFIMVPVIAPAIGQGIIMVTSWRALFILYIVYAVLIGLWAYFRLHETLPAEKRVALTIPNLLKDLKIIFSNRQTMCYTLCMACVFGALIGDLNSSQQIFQEQYSVGKMFVVYFGLQALAFGGASLMNSRWVETYGMRYICLRALVVMTAVSIVFVSLQFAIDITFWMFFIYGVVVLFCVGLLFGNLNSLALEPMGHIAGLASAIISATSNLVAIPLGTIIGQLYDGTIFPLSAGFAILGVFAALFLIVASPKTQ